MPVPEPPDLPGVRWRPLTLADVPALTRTERAIERADSIPEVNPEDAVREDLEGVEDLAADTLAGFDGGGSVVAFGTVSFWRRPPGEARSHRASMWGGVHPGHRTDELEDFVVAWMAAAGERKLAALDDGLPRHVGISLHEHLHERRARLERHGFALSRWYLEMGRDLSVPAPAALPPGSVEMRAWEPALDEQVRLAHNEAFVDHWGSNPLSAERWRAALTGSAFFRPDLSLVAMAGGQVAGYSLGYVYPEDVEVRGRTEAWVGQLGTRRPWRRQGLASALLAATMRAAAAAGIEHLMLGVDAANSTGAVGVYERAGFVPARRWVYYSRDV